MTAWEGHRSVHPRRESQRTKRQRYVPVSRTHLVWIHSCLMDVTMAVAARPQLGINISQAVASNASNVISLQRLG